MTRRVAVVLAGMLAMPVWAFQSTPSITTVEPDTAKTGDTASAKGDNLDKTKVSEFYLTDDKTDTKVAIAEQSEKEIKFKVPKLPAGRYHLMVLTANKASMLEQPVILTVE